MSFRLKTILGIAIIEAALLAFLIFNVLNYLQDSNEKQLLDRVSTTVTLFATAAKDAVIAYDLATLDSLLNSVMDNPGVIYSRIMDVDGRVLSERGAPEILQRTFRQNFSRNDVEDGIFDSQGSIIEADYTYGTVQLGFDIKDLQKTLEDAKNNSIIIAVVEMGLVALFSTFLGIYLTSQLKRLTEASEKVASGSLGYQLFVKGDDEIASTIKAFNKMSLEIKDYVDKVESAKSEMLLAKIEAEKANEAKSLFLSNMSHELRTPLNAVIGFSDILLLEDNIPETEDALIEINDAGKHLLTLINEILDMAKIESGHFHIEHSDVDLDVILEEAVRLVNPLLPKKNISININKSHDGIIIYGDTLRIKQALINLLSNAVKYNTLDGRVDINISLKDNKICQIDFVDTGIGIPEDKVDYLFKPFNRLNEQDYSNEGTGIGLSITKSLIELMSGTLSVSSIEGKGSTFSITLPILESGVENQSRQAEPLAEVTANAGTETSAAVVQPENKKPEFKIVYVEDNPANMRLVSKLLSRREEYHLYMAVTGNEGLEVCNVVKPDLILLDINLPDINGIQVMETLLRNPQFANTPFIAITANAMQTDLDRFAEAGFAKTLTKPINVDEFYQTLEHFCQ